MSLDRAVPTTPPHGSFHKSQSTPTITETVAPPSYLQQSQSGSTLFVLIKGYMNNPDDGNRLLYEISQMPFVVDALNSFIRNLLNHHDEEMFRKMVSSDNREAELEIRDDPPGADLQEKKSLM